MKCRSCGGDKVTSKTTSHVYSECGLTGVELRNVPVRECADCGWQQLRIPRIEKLHQRIALEILRRSGRFTGEEVRYLRKYLGYSQKDLAAQLSVHDTTVSQWETEQKRIGASLAKMIRLLVIEEKQIQSYDRRTQFAQMADVELPPFELLLDTSDRWTQPPTIGA